jgi:gamma-tubulin complex component 2
MKVTNIDDVILHHDKFLDSCLRETMITSSSFFPLIHKILGICITFSAFVQETTHKSQTKEELIKLDYKLDLKADKKIAMEKRKQDLRVIIFIFCF